MDNLDQLCAAATFLPIRDLQVANYKSCYWNTENTRLRKILLEFYNHQSQIFGAFELLPGLVQIENEQSEKQSKMWLEFTNRIECKATDIEWGLSTAEILVNRLQDRSPKDSKSYLPGYLLSGTKLRSTAVLFLKKEIEERGNKAIDSVILYFRPYVANTDTWLEDVGDPKRYIFYRGGDYLQSKFEGPIEDSTDKILDLLGSRVMGMEIIFHPIGRQELNSGIYLNYNPDGLAVAGAIDVDRIIEMKETSEG
jgi:hypothetical protein